MTRTFSGHSFHSFHFFASFDFISFRTVSFAACNCASFARLSSYVIHQTYQNIFMKNELFLSFSGTLRFVVLSSSSSLSVEEEEIKSRRKPKDIIAVFKSYSLLYLLYRPLHCPLSKEPFSRNQHRKSSVFSKWNCAKQPFFSSNGRTHRQHSSIAYCPFISIFELVIFSLNHIIVIKGCVKLMLTPIFMSSMILLKNLLIQFFGMALIWCTAG